VKEELSDYGVSLSEKLLINLHNLCATSGEMARRPDELAQMLQADVNEVNQILDRHVSEGYAVVFTDHEGKRRYYLTSRGIIRVCSLFS
jgi:metal-responsive CopG/Arc/MetJ family transcriptional regulator